MINIENLISFNYISVKKLVLKGMAVLSASAAFVACSHDSFFDENKAQENIKNEYKASFVQKYGEVDPNQSWDFTSQALTAAAGTRGSVEPYTKEMAQEAYNFFSFVNSDFPAVKALLTADTYSGTYKSGKNKKTVEGTAVEKAWNNFFSAKLTPTYAFIKKQNATTYRYYHIGFTYDNIEPIDMISNINVVGRTSDYWYDANSGSLNHHTTRKIDTTPAIAAENVRWCAYYTDTKEDGTPHYKDLAITKYREITIKVQNEAARTYWGFDCDNDGVYMDVICLVREFKNPDPIVKRYMIEDLGAKGDFDFNDIVVDVKDDLQGHQTASVRAMGGTINFKLQIGNTTSTWTKEGSKVKVKVDNQVVEQDTKVNTMYNTQDPDYEHVLAEFPVSGWKPAENNIVVYVENAQSKGTLSITFPRTGEVPMIIACDEIVNWMEEYVPVPKEWWYWPWEKETEEQLP